MIEECIREIVRKGNQEDMEKLSDLLEDIMYELDDETFEKYKKCLYKIAYGEVITKDMAEKIIKDMRPEGMKWSIEETRAVQQRFGLTGIRDVDFWIVMNSKYNDNKDFVNKYSADENQQLEMFVDLTKDFILDPDAKPNKIFKYFM